MSQFSWVSPLYTCYQTSVCVSSINIFIMGWGDLSQEPRRVEVKLFFPPLRFEKSNEEKTLVTDDYI